MFVTITVLLGLTYSVLSMELITEKFIDTVLTSPPTGTQHIHLDTNLRTLDQAIVFSDYYEIQTYTNNLTFADKFGVHSDTVTFMWIPQEGVLVNDDRNAIYCSHQVNGSPTPYSAVIKYDLTTGRRVGWFDAIDSWEYSYNAGCSSIQFDESTSMVYMQYPYKIVRTKANTDGLFIHDETSVNTFSSQLVLTQDGSRLFFPDGRGITVLDTTTMEVANRAVWADAPFAGGNILLALSADAAYTINYAPDNDTQTIICTFLEFSTSNGGLNFTRSGNIPQPYCTNTLDAKSGAFIVDGFFYYGYGTGSQRGGYIDAVAKVDLRSMQVVDSLVTPYFLKRITTYQGLGQTVGTDYSAELQDQYFLQFSL